MRSQWLSPEEMRALQLRRIRRLVEHAFANVPFYRGRFEEIGLRPDDIRTLADFERIPVLTRAEVREEQDRLTAANLPPHSLSAEGTGGSTGEPLRYRRDAESGLWHEATRLRNRTWFGCREGSRQAWIWGSERDLPSTPGHRPVSLAVRARAHLKRQKWLNSFDLSDEGMGAFAETLRRFEPEFLFGYTSSVWLFARYLAERGISDIRPRAAQTMAETLHDFQRELIERVFDCPLLDSYGARELGPIAAQCLDGGLHVAAETHHVEILDGAGPAPSGEVGEVVVTDFTNLGMPFIRYKNGDLARSDPRRCPCGRGLPLLRELAGRTSEFFSTPDGRRISGLYFVHRLRGWPGARRYRVHQSALDRIEVLYEASGDLDEDWIESRRREFQAHVGEAVRLSFERVESIPLTRAGKHLFTTSAVALAPGSDRSA